MIQMLRGGCPLRSGVYREALGLGQSRLHAFNFDPSELQGQRTTMASLPQWFQTKPESNSMPKGLRPQFLICWYQALLLGVLLLWYWSLSSTGEFSAPGL